MYYTVMMYVLIDHVINTLLGCIPPHTYILATSICTAMDGLHLITLSKTLWELKNYNPHKAIHQINFICFTDLARLLFLNLKSKCKSHDHCHVIQI